MRLGGPVHVKYQDEKQWVDAVKALGYRAAYCPVGPDATDTQIAAYSKAAAAADIVIAEVGAWSNPLSPDAATRSAAIEKCQKALQLADRIGARCCVNISGSRGQKWDGPCRDDLTPDTFGMIVETVRGIIDAVRPKRAFYTLETMPWMYPDSAESYLELMRAIDRPTFAVHFDPVNLICSPQRYFGNAGIIQDFVAKLGAHIKSCHAKDILLGQKLTTHLDEVRPGCGALDYRVYLRAVSGLAADVPVMLEHLPNAEEYSAAAAHVRHVAAAEGIKV